MKLFFKNVASLVPTPSGNSSSILYSCKTGINIYLYVYMYVRANTGKNVDVLKQMEQKV